MTEDNALDDVADANKPKTHDEISKRRKADLDGLLNDHSASIVQAQKDYPIPVGMKFQDMDLPAQLCWNQRREVIQKSNESYNAAVRAACARHRAEDAAAQAEALATETEAANVEANEKESA
jgi:hypothetical protein